MQKCGGQIRCIMGNVEVTYWLFLSNISSVDQFFNDADNFPVKTFLLILAKSLGIQ